MTRGEMTDTEILEKRARALAAARSVNTVNEDTDASGRFLMGTCGSERIAVCLTSVAEVYRPAGVTPLPGVVAPLYGLAAWRGRIISIAVIGDCIPGKGAGMVAMLAVGEAVFAGIWLSQVEGEAAIAESDIHDADQVRGGRELFLTGVTGDAVLVLDAVKLKAALERDTPVSGDNAGITSTRSAG